jgi:GNAT superfamily N-acetyltransferase
MTDPAPRTATTADLPRVVDLLVGAFHDDPTWSWAFPDPAARPDQQRRLWTLLVEGALRYPWVRLRADGASTSVWIPPGGTELSPDQEAALEPMLTDLLGAGAGRVLHALEMFEDAHPRQEEHFFLTLLGTDPARRGHGHGLGLLAADLREVDAAGMPAYLEASNPANVALYARQGFEVHGSFTLPDGGPEVVTMWRTAHAGAPS